MKLWIVLQTIFLILSFFVYGLQDPWFKQQWYFPEGYWLNIGSGVWIKVRLFENEKYNSRIRCRIKIDYNLTRYIISRNIELHIINIRPIAKLVKTWNDCFFLQKCMSEMVEIDFFCIFTIFFFFVVVILTLKSIAILKFTTTQRKESY